jgi:hypothetical protein
MAFNLIYDYKNLAATTYAASEDADYPVENLLDYRLAAPYKTGATIAGEGITFDLGSAQSIGAVAILAHTLTSGDSSIRLLANSTDTWASPAFSRTLTYAADNIVETFDAQTYRYWRLVFTKSSAAEVRSIGALFLAPSVAIQPPAPGFEIEEVDTSYVNRVPQSGVVYVETGAQYRQIKFDFRGLDSDDQEALRAMWVNSGMALPVVFQWTIQGIADPQLILYGSITTPIKFTQWGPGFNWDAALQVGEWK